MVDVCDSGIGPRPGFGGDSTEANPRFQRGKTVCVEGMRGAARRDRASRKGEDRSVAIVAVEVPIEQCESGHGREEDGGSSTGEDGRRHCGAGIAGRLAEDMLPANRCRVITTASSRRPHRARDSLLAIAISISATLTSNNVTYMSRSLFQRLRTGPIHLVLDWDGTLTRSDTLHFLGRIATQRRQQAS